MPNDGEQTNMTNTGMGKVQRQSQMKALVPANNALAFNTWSSYWNAIVDGQSNFMRNANPHLAGFSEAHLKSLMWRAVIFQDDVALWLLQENYNLFFIPQK